MRRFLIFCLLLPALSMAASLPVTKAYTLKNGLRLIVRVDRRAPVVLSAIWYGVGSANERSGMTGISHMLEHMMFKGTSKFPNGTLLNEVVAKGGTQNAMTSTDFTMYYQLWPKANLAKSFEFEADRMQHLAMKPADFAKEHQVVMEERRLRTDDNPMARLYERFNAMAFVNGPYHHLPIGWMTDIKHLTLSNLNHWYHEWYVPNNAVVVVVGDVDPSHVYTLAQTYFGPIPHRKLPVIKPRTEITPTGKKIMVVQTAAPTPVIMIGYQVPTFVTSKTAWQPRAIKLLSIILGGNYSARLQSQLLFKQHLASQVTTYYSPLARHRTLLLIQAIPKNTKDISILIKGIQHEVHALQQHPVTVAELKRAKARYKSSLVYSQDQLDDEMQQIAVPAILGLSWKSVTNLKAIDAITSAQVQAVAQHYLNLKQSTTAILKPVSKSQGGK